MTEIYSRKGDQLEMSSKMYRNSKIKAFIAGAIAMAIIFTITVKIIAMAIIFTITVKINPSIISKYDYSHPIQKVVECPLVFTDIQGFAIGKNASDQWELTADQDVLVWLDLPSDIDQLRANINSSYPYDVKAGENGTITMEVDCYANATKYVGTLDFVAADDLTIGAVCHGNNSRNSSVEIHNSDTRNFSWMEAGKHAYVHYPLYTSCEGEYNVYQIKGGQSSSGYNVKFDIVAEGAPEMLYVSNHPDGSMYLEEYEQMLKAKRQDELLDYMQYMEANNSGFVGYGSNRDD